MMKRPLLTLFIGASAAACFSEGIDNVNLDGVVVVPKEVATRDIVRTIQQFDANGDPLLDDEGELVFETEIEEVVNPALIGPVYVGLYSGITSDLEEYPYPERGPRFRAGVEGNTYPYGGTTIGDIRHPCFESLKCKLVSGRFVDFDDIVDWFNNVIQQDVRDSSNNPIENGELFRQTCYELLRFTEDAEVRLTATEDRNGDGVIDARDLDFVENADGDFEAPFRLWFQEFIPGFSAWSFMDGPNPQNYTFSTCNPDLGQRETIYDRDFFVGLQYPDVLNQPSEYLVGGENENWVAGEGYVWEDPYAEARLVIDFPVPAQGAVQDPDDDEEEE